MDKDNLQNQVQSTHSLDLRNQSLSRLWNLKIPPKIKIFWCKCVHNGLPVADNLHGRVCKVYKYYQVCGEEAETIRHMLFGCRIAKEIWSMSLLNICPQFDQHDAALRFLQHLLDLIQQDQDNTLPFFLGWRIWKMHNKLVYENRRDHITQVICATILDKKIWDDASIQNVTPASHQIEDNQVQSVSSQSSIYHIFPQDSDFYCIVDASWKSTADQAEIGWSLISKEGIPSYKGDLQLILPVASGS